MIGCDYCEEWFHPDCLQLSIDDAMALTDTKWKCPVCEGNVTINNDCDLKLDVNDPQGCDKLARIPDVNSESAKCTTKNIDADETKRTKVNVGPGEWLWLVGDQLIPPTQEELMLERYETIFFNFFIFTRNIHIKYERYGFYLLYNNIILGREDTILGRLSFPKNVSNEIGRIINANAVVKSLSQKLL